MSKGWSYVSGDWWITCDSCGKKIKASESRKRWDGFIVCPDDYEERQPLDFIRARVDKISVPFTRPKSDGYSILTYGYVDNVDIVDTGNGGDYIDKTYFAQDYILTGDISIVVDYIRTFSDTSVLDDLILNFDVTKVLSDTITFTDDIVITKFLLNTLTDSFTITDSTLLFDVTKSLSDSVTPVDGTPLFTVGKTLTDSVTMADTSTTKDVQKVLSDSATMSDSSPIFSVTKVFSDSSTLSDSGNLNINGYIDITYFASDYVGSSVTF